MDVSEGQLLIFTFFLANMGESFNNRYLHALYYLRFRV
jgi:hypothetical protein